jgi:hypothetical protein
VLKLVVCIVNSCFKVQILLILYPQLVFMLRSLTGSHLDRIVAVPSGVCWGFMYSIGDFSYLYTETVLKAEGVCPMSSHPLSPVMLCKLCLIQITVNRSFHPRGEILQFCWSWVFRCGHVLFGSVRCQTFTLPAVRTVMSVLCDRN